MPIRLLIVLLLSGFFISTNSIAQNALSSVKILEGIVQQRPPNTRQTLGRRYVWNFKGKSYTVLMTIDIEKYNSYNNKERYDIPKLVEEGRTTIGNLTREFQRVFKRRSEWSEQDRIDFVLSFVQSLPYTKDDVTTGYDEFRRYAIETLIEGGGDCEDTTILVAAILRGLGEKTALIFTPGHIALGVSGNFKGTSIPYEGTQYYYCETTGTGWTVGDLPASSGTEVTHITPLVPATIGTTPTKPDRVITPTPTPTPRTPAPVTTTPEPEDSAPQTGTQSKRSSSGAIVLIFLLIIFGILTAYFLHRSFKEQRDY